jgi:hypothetical protein
MDYKMEKDHFLWPFNFFDHMMASTRITNTKLVILPGQDTVVFLRKD